MTYGFKETTLDTRSSDGRNDLLLTELHYTDLNGDEYKVPVYAESDGGSTPRIVWLVPGFEPTGKHWFKWILHDSAYRGTLLILKDGEWTLANLTRKQSDKLLDRALSLSNISHLARKTVYTTLQATGWKYYQGTKK